MTFNFVQLSELNADHKDSIIDVIGICKSSGDVTTFTSSKSGKEVTKRDLQIVDQR